MLAQNCDGTSEPMKTKRSPQFRLTRPLRMLELARRNAYRWKLAAAFGIDDLAGKVPIVQME